MANQSHPIKPRDERHLVTVPTATSGVFAYLSLCPETSSNYPFALVKTPSSYPHDLIDVTNPGLRKENNNPESAAFVTAVIADLNLTRGSNYMPVNETPATAKSEAVIDASAKARSPSVSSDRSSTSSTVTAAQTPRFLKVCPVYHGRGDGPDDFSPV